MNKRIGTRNTKTRAGIAADVAVGNIHVAVLQREIEKQAGIIRKLNGNIVEKSRECASLQSDLSRRDDTIADLRGRAASCDERVEEARKSLVAAQERFLDEIKNERERSGGLISRLEAMEATNEEVVAENARLVSENARMEEALAASKGKAADMAAALSAAQERFLDEIKNERERSGGLISRLEAMEAKNEKVVADSARLTSENVRLAEELAVARDEAKKLSASLSASQDGSRQFKLKADQRFAEIAVLKERLKKSQVAEAAMKDRAESVGRQLAAANKALRECREREDACRLSKRLNRLAKGVMPYGFVCMWKRMAYGIVEDKPLFYYPGFFKRARRAVKFALPYFAVVVFKSFKYGTRQ